ncbi:retrovirus-related Pol polyprotein from transposon 297 [Trichonephila clavipes]|nr:retrovirus-related Pol polyprotein from transposon 297 [Trichonephila clavipes]
MEQFVKTCDQCQKAGKPNDKKKAPLKLVPVIQVVFTKLNIDACGPLPITSKGNRYLITAICMSSKFPEAIPVSDISSVSVTDALLNIFSRMGFPREIQCDQGTSFTSALTTEFFERFGILVRHSSVYPPQSNPVERFHRTLKRLLRVLCLDAGSEWDKNLPSILLALRTVSHESTGYTPSELVYGKNLRTPETLVMEHWMEPEEEGDLVTEYMFKLINRLKRCQEVAINKMEEMQVKRKTWYDKNAVKREFKDGDLVLVLATSRANKLAVQWIGPGTILNKISETNYLVEIPGRRETSQIYHINMLKPYYKRPEHVNVIINDETKNSLADQELEIPYLENNSLIYDFEDVIQASELNKHLHDKQMDRLRELLNKYSKCFSNNPGLTNLVEHEIQLVSDQPVRTKPYRMSHRQNEILKNEINRMLKLGIIEVGESDYMSPMILVEVAGKKPRPCIDYRKLNGIIRTEYFPLPNIEERVEKVSAAKFITVFDLSKGYWQIPLSKTAQRYAAFCTSFGTYRPLRMSFGLKNAPYFFSKLMAELLNGLEDFVVPYLDDIAIFSDTWESHIKHMETVLQRIKRAKLTIKPSKCKFAQQNVKFLGHIVGQGFRTPSEIKVQVVLEFPTLARKPKYALS